MKKLILSSALLFSTLLIYGQFSSQLPGASQRVKGIGKITGTVFDNEGGSGVEFATISLFREGELIDGTITDDRGKFALNELIDGNYTLEVSYLGYDKIVLKDIVIEKERTVSLDDIYLSASATVLDEVTVTGQRAFIEEKVDRMVYNAEKDNLAKGGDAADVLRKVPLLSVDLEGNVSLRGNSNVQVLINNKPSTIVAANISDALKMLPADMIKTVEVITSPSAKYDAEGSGGIINIITKKNNLEGYYLNVNTGIGLRGSNLGLNGSMRSGKFGMTLGGFGRAFYNKAELDMEQRTRSEGASHLTRQFSDASDNGLFGRYNLGFDYDIDKTQFLSGGIRYGIRNFRRDELQTTELYADDQFLNSSLRDINSKRFSGTADVNLDYLKNFSPGHEFSISTLYSRTDENSNFVSDNLDTNQSFISSIKNLDDNLNQELTFQSDYIRPIGDNQIVEVGGKGIFRKVNSDYSYEFATSEGVFTPDLTRPAGALDYDQNVTAAYTTYTYQTASKYTFKAGVRWEKTSIDAIQDGEAIDIPDYSNIVPSLNLSKNFKNFTTIKLGYNRRIQRPWLRQLNPNVNVQNSQDIQVGNPNLRPELADNIELGISKPIRNVYLNVSVFGRITDNAINQVRYPIDSIPGAILTTFENIGKEKSLGTNIFANITISDKWTLNGGFDLRYAQLEGQVTGIDGATQTATNSGWNYGGRMMSQYKLNGGWTVQAFGFMHGRRVELQGNRGGFGIYSIGLNKDLKNGLGSIGLGAENFLNRGWKVTSELISPAFSQSSNMLLINRNVKVNFNYRFGKLDAQSSRKKTRSVRNDDLMEGGDSTGGMQQGGGAPQGNTGRRGRPQTNRKASSKKSKKGKKEGQS
ncbi:MAG: TonB-dependent receptor [Lewinellaceae bacterium]|nr:TonB-dependent receptor [Lewinellaceae bacterium]